MKGLLLALALAGIVWTGPRLDPAEAARIMAQAPGLANWTDRPEMPGPGPYVALLPRAPEPWPLYRLWFPLLRQPPVWGGFRLERRR